MLSLTEHPLALHPRLVWDILGYPLRERARLPQGVTLGDEHTVESLDLRPGEFLVAVEVRKKQKRGDGPQPSRTSERKSLPAALPADDAELANGWAPRTQRLPPSVTAAAISGPAAGALAVSPARRLRPPAGSEAVSPEDSKERDLEGLDTLLPGYNSRPNPSPAKVRCALCGRLCPFVTSHRVTTVLSVFQGVEMMRMFATICFVSGTY